MPRDAHFTSALAVTAFRIAVLLLAAFYFVDRFSVETFVWDNFGWQFRYLTIWGLTANLVVAAMMLTPAYGGRDGRGAVMVGVAGTVNMIVVVSYWRLFFTDPTLVNGDNAIVAYREFYLHLIGPLLQWIDMLAIKRAFRRPAAVAVWLGVLVIAYIFWAEAIVAPLNDAPIGSVTAGLPYPFLNDMGVAGRMGFYAATWASGLVFIAVFRAAQWGIDRGGVQKSRSA